MGREDWPSGRGYPPRWPGRTGRRRTHPGRLPLRLVISPKSPLVRGCDQPQSAARVGQHDPGPPRLRGSQPNQWTGPARNRPRQSRWPACPPNARRPGPARHRGPRRHSGQLREYLEGRLGPRRSHSSNRTRRSTTSWAMSYIERPLPNAAARGPARARWTSVGAALPGDHLRWPDRMHHPVRANRHQQPRQSRYPPGTYVLVRPRRHGQCPRPPGHPPDVRSLSAPGVSRHESSVPIPPGRMLSGSENSACTPAARAAAANAGRRFAFSAARSGSSTGTPEEQACPARPSPAGPSAARRPSGHAPRRAGR